MPDIAVNFPFICILLPYGKNLEVPRYAYVGIPQGTCHTAFVTFCQKIPKTCAPSCPRIKNQTILVAPQAGRDT
jgi:hypothetical protein